MSATTTSTAASATCNGSIWVLPTQDSACALPNTKNGTDIMDKCCSPASVESYSGDCGLYCLAQEQSLGDLLDCLTSNGAKDGEVFCNDKLNATATATSTASKTSSSSSTDTASATSSDSAAAPGSAARVSKGGLGLLGVVFGAVVLGAF